MLELGTPLWLLGLALIPLVRWLHRFHDSPRVQPVAALFLWRNAPHPAAAGRRRDRPDPRWRLRALVLACLAVALSAPSWQWPRATPLVIWVDDSLSMFAVENGVPRIRNGLERALAAAASAGRDAIVLRSLGDAAASLRLDADTRTNWPAALDQWVRVRGPVAPPLPAVMLGNAEHWLVSDGADGRLSDWLARAPVTRVIQTGRGTENAALTRLSVRPSPRPPHRLQALATVINTGNARARRSLAVMTGTAVVREWQLDLAPGQAASRQLELPANEAPQLVARISPGDALALDDVAALDLGSMARVPVAAVGQCSRPLRSALEAHPRLVMIEQPARAALAVYCATDDPQPVSPAIVLTASPRTWAIDVPVTPAAGVDPARWPYLAAGWLRTGTLQPAGAPLLHAGSRVLVAAREHRGARIVEVGFDITAPELVRRPQFPALIDALVREALGRELLADAVSMARAPTESRITPVPLTPGMAHSRAGGSGTLPLAGFFAFAAVLLLVVDLWHSRRAAGAAGAIGWWRGRAALVRVALMLLLAAALLDPPLPWRAAPVDVIVVLDDSASVRDGAADQAWQSVMREARRLPAGSRLALVRFGTRPVVEQSLVRLDAGEFPGGGAPPRAASIDASATDVAGALEAALRLTEAGRSAAVVLISDGRETRGRALAPLDQARKAGIPVYALGVPSSLPDSSSRIDRLHAPARARSDERIPIIVTLAAPPGATGELELALGGTPPRRETFAVDASGRAAIALELPPQPPGPTPVSVALAAAAGETRSQASIINVEGRAPIIYVARDAAGAALARALSAGTRPLRLSAPERFMQVLEHTPEPGLIVLDDIAATDLGEAAWSALARSVRRAGSGLLVLGGPHSFGAGSYRHSALEELLPVIAEGREPQARLAILFAVDTSGSMAEGDVRNSRLALARLALQETARSLLPGDAVGLHAFDAGSHVLLPLEPRADPAAALQGVFRSQAGGGTRLAPALRDAVTALAASTAQQRLLVLVTDGFVPDEDLSRTEQAIRAAGIDIIALAVGRDADHKVLKRLAALNRGRFLQVDDVATLPRLMRREVEQRRPAFQAGPVPVSEAEPTPFAAPVAPWPALGGYMVTSARPGATVYLRSARGDPVFAAHSAGAGRVAVLPAGLGQWAREWIARPAFGAWLGGLVSWISGEVGAALSIEAATAPGRLLVTAESAAPERGWTAEPDEARLLIEDPAGRVHDIAFEPVAPGRWQGAIDVDREGRYQASISVGSHRARHDVLYQGREELAPAQDDSGLTHWQRAGLVRSWSGRPRLDGSTTGEAGSAPLLLALSLAAWTVLMTLERRPDRVQPALDAVARLAGRLRLSRRRAR